MISREEFEEIREKLRIVAALSPTIVEVILCPYVENEFIKPKLTVERVKAMIENEIKIEQDNVKQEKDYINIASIKYGIATLEQLLKEINEAENDTRTED